MTDETVALEQNEAPTVTGLCLCGCGQPTRLAPKTRPAWGQVKGEPMRYVHGHHFRGVKRRQGADHEVDSNGCWIWQHAIGDDGYGRIWNGRIMARAHRVYYERLVGPVPLGLELDHLCRVRSCVNPNHLEPVTHGENVRRGHRWKRTP